MHKQYPPKTTSIAPTSATPDSALQDFGSNSQAAFETEGEAPSLLALAAEQTLDSSQVDMDPAQASLTSAELDSVATSMGGSGDPNQSPVRDAVDTGEASIGSHQVRMPSLPDTQGGDDLLSAVGDLGPKGAELQVHGDQFDVMAQVNPWVRIAHGMIVETDTESGEFDFDRALDPDWEFRPDEPTVDLPPPPAGVHAKPLARGAESESTEAPPKKRARHQPAAASSSAPETLGFDALSQAYETSVQSPMTRPTVGSAARPPGAANMLQPVRHIHGDPTPAPPIDHDRYSAALAGPSAPMGLGAATQPSTSQAALPLFTGSTARRKSVQTQTGRTLKGANQSGYHPESDDAVLPTGATYTGMYSARALSYISDVANADLMQHGLPATEVQTGHAFNDTGGYMMAISTNNEATQAALIDLLGDPAAMCARMSDLRAGTGAPSASGDGLTDEEIRRVNQHALKLLMWDSLDERRRDAIAQDLRDGSIDEIIAKSRLADLALATKAVKSFFEGAETIGLTDPRKGTHTDEDVLKHGAARGAAYKKKSDTQRAAYTAGKAKGEKPKKPSNGTSLGDGRHAEQNVADVLYAENDRRAAAGEDPFTHAEIQGTMIRCMACTSQLGQNTTIDDPRHDATTPGTPPAIAVAGRGFFAQAHTDQFVESIQARDGDDRTETGPPGRNTVSMPMSPSSPPPSP